MGSVVSFTSEARADLAWREYQEHASRQFDDPQLLLDREYVTRFAVLFDRYKRLAVQQERDK